MSEDWVGGTYESGADDAGAAGNDPIEPTGDGAIDGEGEGVELGLGQGSSFEPEEDAAP